MIIKAGTGHRPNKLGGYSQEVFNKLVDTAKMSIRNADTVITGMALGWDMAMAQAAKELMIPYIAAVPFHGQELMWPKASQEQYSNLLKHAKDVVYVTEGSYAAWKMQERNKWMVDNCDIIVALWDGSSGGTANCVKYAQTKNKLIENYWEHYANSN